MERARDGSVDKDSIAVNPKFSDKKSLTAKSRKDLDHRGNGLYNEAGRNELKMYEAEYEASLKTIGQSKGHGVVEQQSHDAGTGNENKMVDSDDEYDDGIDLQDARTEDDDDITQDDTDHSIATSLHDLDGKDSSVSHKSITSHQKSPEEIDEYSDDLPDVESVSSSKDSDKDLKHANSINSQSTRRSASEKRPSSKKKSRRRKFSG